MSALVHIRGATRGCDASDPTEFRAPSPAELHRVCTRK